MTPSTDQPIRTFHGRHGRTTPRMRRILDTIGSRRGVDAHDPERPLVLEVGSGHGEAALGFAAAHPDVDLLAVDVHTPGVARLLELADERRLDNVFVERTDALAVLRDRVAPAGLAGVHVFFPDPWPKTRHHKRRFIRPDVLDLLADRLADGGRLLVATDDADYARRAHDQLDGHDAFVGGEAGRPTWRPVTRYEARAVEAGRPVSELGYRRRSR